MKELTFLVIGVVIGSVVMKCRRDRQDLKREVEILRQKTAN